MPALIRARQPHAATMRGMSLVELMVGVAVGLFVVAAAALLTSSQLTDNRYLLIETQVQQDLRAAADMVTRDLRRTAYWGSNSQSGTPGPTPAAGGITANPYNVLLVPDGVSNALRYSYRRASGIESFGFRLDNDGVLRACQSDNAPTGCTSGWQDLSDPNTIRITDFYVVDVPLSRQDNQVPVQLPCPNLCPDGTTACWPKAGLRELKVYLKGKSRSDERVVRELTTTVRVRNLNIILSPDVPSGQACPPAP